MSQLRHVPRALDTQGHQGKKVGYIFSHPPVQKDPPLSIDDCRSIPAAKARNARMQNSLDHIVPSNHSRTPRELAKQPTMEFGTTMPGSRISLKEHHAGPTQEDCQQLDTPVEALFTTAAFTCNSPIGFQTAILSSETTAVGNPTKTLLPPPPSYKRVPRCRTISRLFLYALLTFTPQLRHLLHPCWCKREVHFPVQSVLTALHASCQRMSSRHTDVLE
jgi:hypothetical protein